MTDVISTKEQIHSFIDNLEVALNLYGGNVKCNRIILYGMGGSAISNDVVSDYCMERSNIPITVIKGSALPAWADGNTLVITSSYSGNTLETLEAYGNAKKRRCKVICHQYCGCKWQCLLHKPCHIPHIRIFCRRTHWKTLCIPDAGKRRRAFYYGDADRAGKTNRILSS